MRRPEVGVAMARDAPRQMPDLVAHHASLAARDL
jgi:hypothetical protein